MRALLFGLSVWLAPLTISFTLAQGADRPVLKPLEPPYTVAGTLNGEDGARPEGVSGIACLPAATPARRCLVINDERREAQFVTLENRMIAPGEDVALIGREPSAATLGRPPEVTTCPGGPGRYADLDGEGVAFAAPYFYVVGSHGCARRTGTFKLSVFVLARVPVDAQGRPSGPAETTYRLSDALRAEPTLGPSFGQGIARLKESDPDPSGIDIEGVAVLGDRLFVGLRAPSLGGTAHLLGASIADLFAPGQEPLRAAPELISLDLGPQTGIRDLAPLPDGRLLVLAGPAQEQADVRSRLLVVEPRRGGSVQEVGVLPDLPVQDRAGKAEAVAVLGPTRVLILFDSLLNGGPREYELPAPLYAEQ